MLIYLCDGEPSLFSDSLGKKRHPPINCVCHLLHCCVVALCHQKTLSVTLRISFYSEGWQETKATNHMDSCQTKKSTPAQEVLLIVVCLVFVCYSSCLILLTLTRNSCHMYLMMVICCHVLFMKCFFAFQEIIHFYEDAYAISLF